MSDRERCGTKQADGKRCNRLAGHVGECKGNFRGPVYTLRRRIAQALSEPKPPMTEAEAFRGFTEQE